MSYFLEDKRIFIIEDNLADRAIMQMLLEQTGAKIGIERWGKDVLRRLKFFGQVDIILLDLTFPNGVEGYEVFDEIRTVDAYANIPIVAVSAGDSFINIPRCRAQGFAGFIPKPISYDLFPRQIASILDGKAIWYTTKLELT